MSDVMSAHTAPLRSPPSRILFLLAIVAVQTASGHLSGLRATKENNGGRILSILDYGAIPDSLAFEEDFFPWTFHEFEEDGGWNEPLAATEWPLSLSDLCVNNTQAFNMAVEDAQPGDTVLVPDGHSFTLIGGLLLNDKHGITIDFAGTSHFAYDLSIWPFGIAPPYLQDVYDAAVTIFNCTEITLTSSSKKLAQVNVDYDKNMVYLANSKEYRGGIINGYGKQWWNDAISGRIREKSRPKLIHFMESTNVKVEKLTLLNSPFWTLTVEAIRAEVSHVNVLVDRRYQTSLLKDDPLAVANLQSEMQRMLGNDNVNFFPELPDWVGRRLRQPEDLNTDGIDPSGTDIWIHHCIVQNADDSIAVKPLKRRTFVTNMPSCTTNVTIEHTVLTGFGASVGSVGPDPMHNCVDGVRFHNISMPGSGKGIYIKSDGSDCNEEDGTSQITNIVYDGVHMYSPFWWPIWIGPQQQHEPKSEVGLKCPLTYPLPGPDHCPTQGCTTFANITLRNIYIHNPVISPGVILGNETNPMKNFDIENLTVHVSSGKPWDGKWPYHEDRYPYRGRFQCRYIEGTCKNCHPAPRCLTEI